MFDEQDTGSSNHEWISQEEMRRLCPGVTLSDYQLVGVNWMALLHGMKCNIDNRNANVNGVLADEMGLVSIVDRDVVVSRRDMLSGSWTQLQEY